MKPLELDYFYGNDAEQFTFYRIPKVLFTDQRYKSVSVEAKVLYGLLLDRMSLSIRNDWLDADGRVYPDGRGAAWRKCLPSGRSISQSIPQYPYILSGRPAD